MASVPKSTIGRQFKSGRAHFYFMMQVLTSQGGKVNIQTFLLRKEKFYQKKKLNFVAHLSRDMLLVLLPLHVFLCSLRF